MSRAALADAFKKTAYSVVGHGPRNVRVLKRAFEEVDGDLESDMYGKGKVIESFQAKMAAFLGKEAAVFFPSGTMAQQIALRLWCDEKGIKRVAYHPRCHLEIAEEGAVKELHHIEPVLLATPDRLIELEDVTGMEEEVACLLLELPQRELGGELPPYEELESISRYCRENGLRLHMDGARLYETLPYYRKSAAEVCSLFDSVYVSLYKGIGSVAGAILAGSADFTEKSKAWKRRHGGDLISLYPYIIAADYYFELRKDRMPQYYEGAKELAALYNRCRFASVRPRQPVSNMFHAHFDLPKEKLEDILVELYGETDIGLASSVRESNGGCYFEVTVGDRYAAVPKEELAGAIELLDDRVGEARE